jgi:diguanylate cyclase (GGDEF)-like protein
MNDPNANARIAGMKLSRFLVLATAVPCVLVAVLLTAQIRSALHDQAQAEAAVGHTVLAGAARVLVQELQTERGLTANFVDTQSTHHLRALTGQRDKTDAARTAFEGEAVRVLSAGVPAHLQDELRRLRALLDQAQQHRSRVEALTLDRAASVDFYTKATGASFDLLNEMSNGAPTLDVSKSLRAAELFMRGLDLVAAERTLGQTAYARGVWSDAHLQELARLAAQQDLFFRESQRLSEAGMSDLVALSGVNPSAQRFLAARAAILEGDTRTAASSQAEWMELATGRIRALQSVEAQLLQTAQGLAETGALSAQRRLLVLVAIAGGALMAVATGLVVSARLLRRSAGAQLRKATEAANAALAAAQAAAAPQPVQEAPASLPAFASQAALTTAPQRAVRSDAVEEARFVACFDEWLGSADTMPEIFEVIDKYVSELIPEAQGVLYIASPTQNVLSGALGWNGGRPQDHIHPNDCWSLRRSRTFVQGAREPQLGCKHDTTGLDDMAFTLCVPISVHGDTVGMMHLRVPQDAPAARPVADVQRLAELCADRIAPALANILLRTQLVDRSVRDPLTGLYNRQYFADHLTYRMDQVRRNNETLSVLTLDVDEFKTFNEKHGHEAGDAVLRAIAGILQEMCSGDEIACRLGGEEMALLLPGQTAEDVLWRAEKLRQAVEDQIIRSGEKTLPSVTISAGIACAPEHGLTMDSVMGAAEEALCRAKAHGRNQVEYLRADGSNLSFISVTRESA